MVDGAGFTISLARDTEDTDISAGTKVKVRTLKPQETAATPLIRPPYPGITDRSTIAAAFRLRRTFA